MASKVIFFSFLMKAHPLHSIFSKFLNRNVNEIPDELMDLFLIEHFYYFKHAHI